MHDISTMKRKELHKEYTAFIGENKADYYIKKFGKLQDDKKISINLAAFLFSTFWCFYRKLFIPGAIFLVVNFAGIYASTLLNNNIMGSICSLIPAMACGFLGNYWYMQYANKYIVQAQDMSQQQKQDLYQNYGGDSTRITLGIVAAFLFFTLAVFFSAGTPT